MRKVFRVTAYQGDGHKCWLATFSLETDAYHYSNLVRKANPTWATIITFSPASIIDGVLRDALSELNDACDEDETINHNRSIGKAIETIQSGINHLIHLTESED